MANLESGDSSVKDTVGGVGLPVVLYVLSDASK